MDETYAIHFGAYGTHYPDPPVVVGVTDTQREHAFFVDGFRAFISGSWQCWGPEDQETDGDLSLHVVVLVPDDFPPVTSTRILRVREALVEHLGRNTRLLDYAVVSTARDWSEQTYIATFVGIPEVSLYNVSKVGRVG